MPVYSMTGFGHSSATDTDPVELDIRSVNSRFLDLSFKLSDELRQFEAPLRTLLTTHLKRGKVEVRAFVAKRATAQDQPLSKAAIASLAKAQDVVLAEMPTARPLSVADVLRLAESDTASKDLTDALMRAAQSALQAMLTSREREGDKLTVMLRGHIASLQALAERAAPLIPALVEQQRQKFIEKFNQALQSASSGVGAQSAAAGGSISQDAARERALTEATSFAIRIDVAEELTRLTAHLDEIDALLVKGGELGKRLDFTIQELHREANTLGSKSSTLEVSRISVDMKVLIEQLREQVQNIE